LKTKVETDVGEETTTETSWMKGTGEPTRVQLANCERERSVRKEVVPVYGGTIMTGHVRKYIAPNNKVRGF